MMHAQPTRRPRRAIHRVLATLAILFLAFLAWAYPRVQAARESACHTVCKGRLGKLQLALINYHEIHGSFPPAYIADTEGNPMHSWRVLILPYLGHPEVYKRYRFDEPWNSPHNRKIGLLSAVESFHCPSEPNREAATTTDYVLVVGKDTAFPRDLVTKLSEFRDGAENTILVVEINNSDIHWMEPRDLDAETMSYSVNDPQRPSVSAPHPLGPAVVFADRIRSYRLPSNLPPATLKALTTIAGDERVTKDNLFPPTPMEP